MEADPIAIAIRGAVQVFRCSAGMRGQLWWGVDGGNWKQQPEEFKILTSAPCSTTYRPVVPLPLHASNDKQRAFKSVLLVYYCTALLRGPPPGRPDGRLAPFIVSSDRDQVRAPTSFPFSIESEGRKKPAATNAKGQANRFRRLKLVLVHVRSGSVLGLLPCTAAFSPAAPRPLRFRRRPRKEPCARLGANTTGL